MRAGSNIQIQNKLYSSSIQQTAPHVLRLKNASKPKNVRPWCLIKANHTAAEFTSHQNTRHHQHQDPLPPSSVPRHSTIHTHSYFFLGLPIKEHFFIFTEQLINSWLKVTFLKDCRRTPILMLHMNKVITTSVSLSFPSFLSSFCFCTLETKLFSIPDRTLCHIWVYTFQQSRTVLIYLKSDD